MRTYIAVTHRDQIEAIDRTIAESADEAMAIFADRKALPIDTWGEIYTVLLLPEKSCE